MRSRELTAAICGAGLALLPCLVRLTVRVLANRELSPVYTREARVAEPVRCVIDFVIDVMRENAERISGSAER